MGFRRGVERPTPSVSAAIAYTQSMAQLRTARLAVLVLVAAASAACFSSQTVIKLHPNGSGTIEQTNLVNTAMIGMAAGHGQVGGEGGQAARNADARTICSAKNS